MSQVLTIVVRVRDTYVGVKGKFAEECVTTNPQEAESWFKQWKSEYDKDSGFKVTRKVYPFGLPADFQYSL